MRLEDSLLYPDEQGMTSIFLQNPGRVAFKLKPTDDLGMAEVCMEEESEVEDSEQILTVAHVNSGESVEGRQEVLRKSIDVCSEGLSQEEQQALIVC